MYTIRSGLGQHTVGNTLTALAVTAFQYITSHQRNDPLHVDYSAGFLLFLAFVNRRNRIFNVVVKTLAELAAS